jgi:hypothetical protein
MNNEEAKFILRGYRPNGADAHDAAIREALEQVERDPALRAWFANEQAFDAAVSAKLGAVTAPAGLREALMAGGRVSNLSERRTEWWRSPVVLATAASIAVVFSATLALWPKQAAAGTGLAEHILTDLSKGGTHMGFHGTEALQAMLGDPANRLARGLPIDFEALKKAGCRTVTYEGREVLEVCFNRGGIWFHAYIGRRGDFPGISDTASFVDRGGSTVATWADEAYVYLVASKAGRAAVERLF